MNKFSDFLAFMAGGGIKIPAEDFYDKLAETELALLKTRGEIAKQRRQIIIDLDKLDAEIIEANEPKKPPNPQHDSPAEREAARLQQEIDNIVRKISTIAGLERACVEMKARSPQQFWPLIDRLFRKIIDFKKEQL